MDSAPPSTIDPTVPMNCASTPLSNAPSSLDAPTNTRSTATTRPRRCGGVSSGASVERMNTLTMSLAESKSSTPNVSQNESLTPSRIVNTPNPATEMSRIGPTRARMGRPESRMPTTTAPMPGAARSTP